MSTISVIFDDVPATLRDDRKALLEWIAGSLTQQLNQFADRLVGISPRSMPIYIDQPSAPVSTPKVVSLPTVEGKDPLCGLSLVEVPESQISKAVQLAMAPARIPTTSVECTCPCSYMKRNPGATNHLCTNMDNARLASCWRTCTCFCKDYEHRMQQVNKRIRRVKQPFHGTGKLGRIICAVLSVTNPVVPKPEIVLAERDIINCQRQVIGALKCRIRETNENNGVPQCPLPCCARRRKRDSKNASDTTATNGPLPRPLGGNRDTSKRLPARVNTSVDIRDSPLSRHFGNLLRASAPQGQRSRPRKPRVPLSSALYWA